MKVLGITLSDKKIKSLQNDVRRGADNECWPWLRGTDDKGYGRTYVDGRCCGAHRIFLCIAKGEPPIGLPFALHSCDNPSCCNPSHLRWGNHTENMHDRALRNTEYVALAPAIIRANVIERERIKREAMMTDEEILAFADSLSA